MRVYQKKHFDGQVTWFSYEPALPAPINLIALHERLAMSKKLHGIKV